MSAWPAPAKLNLFLHIVDRRSDGYHLLQTVFQFLDVGDELDFRVRGDGLIRPLHRLEGVAPEEDLTVRAASLLQRTGGTRLGADIRLIKRLPLGAGLGGGSSDAATTLVVLNQLWQLGLSLDELAGLGLQLGADVPVFVHGQAAWAEGVGEKLTSLVLAQPWYLVVVPPCRVSTREVFADPELTRNTTPITIASFHAGKTNNDCAPVVYRRYPEVAQARERLARFAPPRLTGTGACVFASFATEVEARRVWDRLAPDLPGNWHGFIAAGLNRSPLHERLGQ
jgi:4-diphosphocytidyl-2-C-methyl-D-erythritol kinase